MPLRKALAASQFDRPGWSKPVTRGEATSAVYGLSGHECGDIDRTLKHVLWPYWEDATPPVHVPKEFPPDMAPSERARSHQSGAVAFSGRLSRSTPTIGKKPASDDLIPVVVARGAHALLAGADLHGPRDGEILTTST